MCDIFPLILDFAKNMKSKHIDKDSIIYNLNNWVEKYPNKIAYRYLTENDDVIAITYQDLQQKIFSIAAKLQIKLNKGDRVILLYQQGLDYIFAFWACLYAGVVAVPAYPPRSKRQAPRIHGIIKDTAPHYLMTTSKQHNALKGIIKSDTQSIDWLITDLINRESSDQWQPVDIQADDLAFLQYTSGSTGDPKGVMVSHGNLLCNEQMITEGLDSDSDITMVSWLPLFHDMGLIGGMLHPIFVGGECVIMSPNYFLQKPIRWLNAINKYRGTLLVSPNFALDLCADTITAAEKESLDLSSVEIYCNGSEPIRNDSLNNFYSAFKQCGLKLESLFPTYGMAETTLMVTSSGKLQGYVVNEFSKDKLKQGKAELSKKDNTIKLVSSGRSIGTNQKVLIIDPVSLKELNEGTIGEIWICGQHVAHGYWNKEEYSKEIFENKVEGFSENFLRTGDLGFILESEIFVTGRMKDAIIINGRNYYPQDIEKSSEQSHLDLRKTGSTSFAIEKDGKEQVVICQELERSAWRRADTGLLQQAIRDAIWVECDLMVDEVVLLRPASIPKTSSGKVQRQKCKQMYLDGLLKTIKPKNNKNLSESKTSNNSSVEELNSSALKNRLRNWLISKIAEMLDISITSINPSQPFSSYGMGSIEAIRLSGLLNDEIGKEISATIAYDYPTIDKLVEHVYCDQTHIEKIENSATLEPIAVISADCHFPGAENIEKFWELIINGKDGISEVPQSRWNIDDFYCPDSGIGKMNSKYGGFITDIDLFDNDFFEIPPEEVLMLDPQQRLLLEISWRTLERANLSPKQLFGSDSGVFIGVSNNDYGRTALSTLADLNGYVNSGNALSIAANRISYFMNWKGPSMAIDTACSSSLIAIHQACQSLRHKECSLALAGGVNLIVRPELTIAFSQAQMMATDGKCKTFDAQADGYVRSEGCGLVLLKRLEDAKKDGDNILGIIKSSAINQDGRSNGLTAPNSQSQKTVIKQAVNLAGIKQEDISYIECHGTGTALGDPIEVNALRDVFANGDINETCIIGSVKANIGHLESAAGVAGFIKTLLAIQNEKIPQQVNFNSINPSIELGKHLKIVTKNQQWPAKEKIAGISAFSFGGSNAHVILAQAPRVEARQTQILKETPQKILCISANDKESLKIKAKAYSAMLQANHSLAELCDSTFYARAHLKQRLAIVTNDKKACSSALIEFSNGNIAENSYFGAYESGTQRLAFLCAGHGGQYPQMGAKLYKRQKAFRDALKCCAKFVKEENGVDILSVLFEPDNHKMDDIKHSQVVLFSLEYALCRFWQSININPDAIIGHGLGEYVAACIAGVFSLEDALKLVISRSYLITTLDNNGAMATLQCDSEHISKQVKSYGGDLSIAAINSTNNVVVSGEAQQLTEFLRSNTTIKHKRLNTSKAFHSVLMQPMLFEFKKTLATVKFSKPNINIVSNITGKFIDKDMMNPEYWLKHTHETIKFSEGIKTLVDFGVRHFLEIGPELMLSPYVDEMNNRQETPAIHTYASLTKQENDWKHLCKTAAKLYSQGMELHASFFMKQWNKLLSLPLTGFDKKRYWIDSELTKSEQATHSYRYEWKEINWSNPTDNKPDPYWLILSDGSKLQEQICNELHRGKQQFKLFGTADNSEILKDVVNNTHTVKIIYLWALENQNNSELLEYCSGYKLTELWKQLRPSNQSYEFWGITADAFFIGKSRESEETRYHSVIAQGLWSYWRGLMKEYPLLNGGMIDLELNKTFNPSQLLDIVSETEFERQIVLRDEKYYGLKLKSVDTSSVVNKKLSGTYVVTGAFGGVGKSIVEMLYSKGIRDFVFISRSKLPKKQLWSSVTNKEIKRQIKFIQKLENKGANINSFSADVRKKQQLINVFDVIEKSRCPEIKGIVHCAGLRLAERADEISNQAFNNVVLTKVLGALNLHKISLSLNLEQFIMCSSAGAVLGSPGQVFYGAANACLDGLAAMRNAIKLPALSINWGPWSDHGMFKQAEEKGEKSVLSEAGIKASSSIENIRQMQGIIDSGHPQVMIANIDWHKYHSLNPDCPTLSAYESLITNPEESSEQSALTKKLLKYTVPEREKIIVDIILDELSKVLKNDQTVSNDTLFDALGMDSITSIEFKNSLQKSLQINISPTITYNYPCTELLAKHILEDLLKLGDKQQIKEASIPNQVQPAVDEAFAIVGMSCRFPGGADTPEKYWQLLLNGEDVITEVPKNRWDIDKFYHAEPATKGKMYSRYGAFIDDVDLFAADFFNISHREAKVMDPQHRILLEVCWQAFENAGISIDSLKDKSCGIYVGIGQNDYSRKSKIENIDTYTGTGNGFSFAAGRIAHVFGLRGPTMSIDTACSSSLMALHLACQSLKNSESDVALATGVQLMLSPETAVFLSQSRALTAGKTARIFDNKADGFLRGEGCGAVIVKRLADAQRDGDNILAQICATATNHDGRSRGLTVPNGGAQKQLMQAALKNGNLAANSIDVVEAHGTGTILGDPVEVEALADVYAVENRLAPLEVRSVKANIGHLEAAAGIASVIKMVLSLQHRIIPAQIHFTEGNSHINWDSCNISITNKNKAWPVKDDARRAAISAFGLSGSNVHVILEDAPIQSVEQEKEIRSFAKMGTADDESVVILLISAVNKLDLKKLAETYINSNKINDTNLQSFCLQLNSGRKLFKHRLAIPAVNAVDLLEKLEGFALNDDSYYGVAQASKTNVSGLLLQINPKLNSVNQTSLSMDIDITPFVESNLAKKKEISTALAELCINHQLINWHKFFPNTNGFLRLPNYPLPRKRFWIEEAVPEDESDNALSMALNKDDYQDILAEIYRKSSFQADDKNALVELLDVLKSYNISETQSNDNVKAYEVNWQEKPQEQDVEVPNQAVTNWIIYAESSHTCLELLKSFEQRGDEFLLISSKNNPVMSYDCYLYDEFDNNDLSQIFKSEDSNKNNYRLLYLANFDIDINEPGQLEKSAGYTLSTLLKDIERNTRISELYVLTSGAVDIDGGCMSIKQALQAPLLACARSLALEQPMLSTHTIDMEPRLSLLGEKMHLVMNYLPAKKEQQQIAIRGHKTYIPVLNEVTQALQKPAVIDADSAYLISGGFGGLAFEMAKYLIKNGARYLILSSRTSREKMQQLTIERIAALEELGADVHYLHIDLCDEEKAKVAIKKLHQKREIKGIIHAAGSIKRAEFSAISHHEFLDMVSAKISNTLTLHEASIEMNLDFFWSFSSISATFGTKELGHYAASNAFLDAFSSYRRHKGLVAQTINWGPWKDIGMLKNALSQTKSVDLSQSGIIPESSDDYINAFAKIMSRSSNNIVLANINWDVFLPLMSMTNMIGLFENFSQTTEQTTTAIQSELLEKIKNATAKLRQILLSEFIQKEVSAVLHMDSELPAKNTGFNELGIDSIMAIEIKTRISQALNIILSATSVFNFPTINKLSEHILAELLQLDDCDQPLMSNADVVIENAADECRTNQTDIESDLFENISATQVNENTDDALTNDEIIKQIAIKFKKYGGNV
jgi:acyl transferase domain-containing protein/acyl-CoA synthetase (AMP-forming)/AMP-acid ligase II/acyl carrier protein/short-subunit dehydrogenase